ncbi:MAG: Hsp70 family protein, partial [Myxococcota bacterium]
SGFQTGPRTDVEIEVGFDIDTDGILSVRARDRRTGEESSTRITLTSGLSESEIQELLARDVTARVRSSVEVADDASPASLPPGLGASPHEDAGPSEESGLSEDLSAPDPGSMELVAGDDDEADELELGPMEEDLSSCDDLDDATHTETPGLEREVVGVHEPSGPTEPGDEAAHR